MIVFNGSEAIEIAKPSDVNSIFTNHSVKSERLPYVQLQRGKDRALDCELGFVDTNGIHKGDEEDIQIGHVIISWIDVEQEIHKENMWISDEYYIDYRYSFKIYLDSNYQKRYEFYSTDRVTYDNGTIKSKSNNSIISFFTYIIPLINNAIDSGISSSNLNMEYFYQKYSDGGREYASYETNPYSISLDDALNLVYSLNVRIENCKPHAYSDDDVTCYATFDGKNGIIYNLYIAKLFSKIIHATISKQCGDNNNTVYSAKLHELPNYLKYDAESLRRYLLRKLYIGILLNYNQNDAEEGFCHCDRIQDCKEVEQGDKVRSILNFLLGMKATRFEDGENRVGRDDRGWTEFTVLFPTEFGFIPSQFFLGMINDTLDVKLERQDKNLCYYHRYTTEAEYIAGRARRREFCSFELQRNYLHSLLKKIVPLLSSEDDIDKLIAKE